jgi:hypothetical protein
MRSHRITTMAYVVTLVLACIGITGGFGAVLVLVSSDRTLGGALWAGACVALSACLVAGLVSHDRRPARSTVLLVIGCPAIALAWFWLPPAYLLSVVLAVAAVISRPRAPLTATG